jgi:hypothetical protein
LINHHQALIPISALFLGLTVGAASSAAQGFQPSAPTQELIYFGGRLIAVEERGPGGNGGNSKVKVPAKAGLKAADGSVPVTSPGSNPGITPPQQPPQPVFPPQDSTAAAAPLPSTPVITHVTAPAPQ